MVKATKVYTSLRSCHGGNLKILWMRISTCHQHLIGGRFGLDFLADIYNMALLVPCGYFEEGECKPWKSGPPMLTNLN